MLDPEAARLVLRRRRRAEPRVQLHAAALEVPGARSCAPRSRRPSSYLPGERVAGVDGRQPRQPPLPDALVRRRSRRKTRAAMVMLMGLRGTPFLYYGDEIGMPDTDDPRRPRARSGRRVPRRAHGPRPRAHADALDRRAGRGLLGAGRRAVAPVRRRRRVQRRRPAPRSRLDALAHPRSHRPARRDARAARAAPTRRCPAPTTACGRGSAATAPSSRATAPTTPVDVADVGAGAIRISTIRARDGERVDGSLHLEPWEAAIVWRDAERARSTASRPRGWRSP